MLNFERTNEKGTVRLTSEEPLLFEFQYSNRFYGECSFEASVRVETNRGLVLKRDTIEVLDQKVRRGTEENLISSALLFFTRAIHGYSSQRLRDESRVENHRVLPLGSRFRYAIQKWRDQFLTPVHPISLSAPLEVKNKQNLK